MRSERDHGITTDVTERLLMSHRDTWQSHRDTWQLGTERPFTLGTGNGEARRLAYLLAGAAGPATAAELAGEDAALHVYRMVRLGSLVSAAPSRSTAWPAAFRLGPAAAAATVLALGGVAVAAGTGVLSVPVDPTSSPALTHAWTPSQVGSSPAAATSGPSELATPTPPAATSLSLVGLCQAFLAQAAAGVPEPADNPAFAALVAAAGSPDAVVPFCTAQLGLPSAAPDSANQQSGSHPTGPPSPPPTRVTGETNVTENKP